MRFFAVRPQWDCVIDGDPAVADLHFLDERPQKASLFYDRAFAEEGVEVANLWGVNGFASVLAPPLATAIGMMKGFWLAGVAALGCYLVVAVVFAFLPVANSKSRQISIKRT